MRLLVVNAGSSSLKLSVLDGERMDQTRDLGSPGRPADGDAVIAAVREMGALDAVGHRVVHGGERYRKAELITDAVLAELWELSVLAPLHQARSLSILESVREVRPDLPTVACFDTAFHHTIPRRAATYPLPLAWRERWGLRRFGFHGLSHAYAARRAAELLERPLEGLRIVTCHLGAGASLAAVQSGRSVDTTMGFTPLEGLAMATRSGTVDPGLLLWLLAHTELNEQQIAHALEHDSGMLGLAGSEDMRVIVERAAAGDASAETALEVYVHRLRGGIAAMAAAMNGLDVVAWTGGVGEHAPSVRAAASGGLGFLGVQLDQARNESAVGDHDLTAPGGSVASVLVVAREDLEIARQVRSVLS